MKSFMFLGVVFVAAVYYLTLSGCSTSQPGTTDTLGTYSTSVAATPDKVTEAANKACGDLNLLDVNSTGTSVDGKVTARTAQGQDIDIEIAQAGDGVSKVSIRVGATGDESISKQLVDRINDHL
jgi:uncharacterized protein DUF3568